MGFAEVANHVALLGETVQDVDTTQDLFNWIRKCSERLNEMYNELDPREAAEVRGIELSVYRKLVRKHWDQVFETCRSFNDLEVFSILRSIGLVAQVDAIICKMAKLEIDKQVEKSLNEQHILHNLMEWTNYTLMSKLAQVVDSKDKMVDLNSTLISAMKMSIVEKRVQMLFELVEEYPRSLSQLQELNKCLSSDVEKENLMVHFITQLNFRLLIPSINTSEIISFYTKTIRSFLLIDSRGVMLDKVARPIRQQLRSRPDTMEKIVNALLNSDPASNPLIEFYHELLKSATSNNSNNLSPNEQSFDAFLKWNPQPMEALPDFRIGKIDDIIDSLISIFDIKKSFVEQFVILFSKELLEYRNSSYSDVIKHVQYKLELLKRKFRMSDNFSSNEFNVVDIMINDIGQSEKLDEVLSRQMPNHYPHIDGVFLSHQYWSSLSEPNSQKSLEKIPEHLLAPIKLYMENYKIEKRGRHLALHAEQSMVELVIEINGIEEKLNVKFYDYVVLQWLYENTNINEETWSSVKLGFLVMKLGLPLQTIRQALSFWKSKKILIDEGGNWKINE